MNDIEDKIREFFDYNYQLLRLEGGHALTPNIKEQALEQVLLYWMKLKDLAEKVTDAEVRLSLPNQETPAGRTFSIEGVVDIVQENENISMYDIKTHDLNFIKENIGLYEEQLNVYAHVWQELRNNRLDLAAVISTSVPKSVRDAFRADDEAKLKKAIEAWDPVVPIEFDSKKVNRTVKEFGAVVDAIEEDIFGPPPLVVLQEKIAGTKETFATNICRNCDGRFSCPTYREYAQSATRGKVGEFMKYFESSQDQDEQEDWLAANSDYEDEERGE